MQPTTTDSIEEAFALAQARLVPLPRDVQLSDGATCASAASVVGEAKKALRSVGLTFVVRSSRFARLANDPKAPFALVREYAIEHVASGKSIIHTQEWPIGFDLTSNRVAAASTLATKRALIDMLLIEQERPKIASPSARGSDGNPEGVAAATKPTSFLPDRLDGTVPQATPSPIPSGLAAANPASQGEGALPSPFTTKEPSCSLTSAETSNVASREPLATRATEERPAASPPSLLSSRSSSSSAKSKSEPASLTPSFATSTPVVDDEDGGGCNGPDENTAPGLSPGATATVEPVVGTPGPGNGAGTVASTVAVNHTTKHETLDATVATGGAAGGICPSPAARSSNEVPTGGTAGVAPPVSAHGIATGASGSSPGGVVASNEALPGSGRLCPLGQCDGSGYHKGGICLCRVGVSHDSLRKSPKAPDPAWFTPAEFRAKLGHDEKTSDLERALCSGEPSEPFGLHMDSLLGLADRRHGRKLVDQTWLASGLSIGTRGARLEKSNVNKGRARILVSRMPLLGSFQERQNPEKDDEIASPVEAEGAKP